MNFFIINVHFFQIQQFDEINMTLKKKNLREVIC